eukprot:3261680-Prymnesium_polylepis.1
MACDDESEPLAWHALPPWRRCAASPPPRATSVHACRSSSAATRSTAARRASTLSTCSTSRKARGRTRARCCTSVAG